MRDFETIETALLAAETGHLVFSTLHTLDATETINRIIAVFPPHQQKQVRLQLASVLKAVDLAAPDSRADGKGRVPAVEVLITTPFIRDCIVDKDKTHLIHGAIAQGTSQYGMQTFDQSIFSLFEQGLVSYEEALRWASNVDEFKLKVQGISTTADMARDQMASARRRRSPPRSPAIQPEISACDSPTTHGHGRLFDGLQLLARRELSEAQIRQRLARRATTRGRSTPPSRGSADERALDDARVRRRDRADRDARSRGRGALRVQRQIDSAGIDRDLAQEARRRGLRRRSTPSALLDAALDTAAARRATHRRRPRVPARSFRYLRRPGLRVARPSLASQRVRRARRNARGLKPCTCDLVQ